MRRILTVSVAAALGLAACASAPRFIVDPASIADQAKYSQDGVYCKQVSETYDKSAEKAGGAALGAVGVLGTAALVAGSGGLYLLPLGVLAALGVGAGVGSSGASDDERRGRENIWAQCMTERGYKVFNPNG